MENNLLGKIKELRSLLDYEQNHGNCTSKGTLRAALNALKDFETSIDLLVCASKTLDKLGFGTKDGDKTIIDYESWEDAMSMRDEIDEWLRIPR